MTNMNMGRLYLITRITAAFALLIMVCGLVAPQPVFAACPEGQQEVSVPIDQGGTKCVPINGDSANIQDNPIFFYLKNILIFLAGGVGLAVVGGIIAGAYMYITARANASQTEKGKDMIINSIIGLLLFVFMYAILQFLIPGGIFS